jgi:hypothetical protein
MLRYAGLKHNAFDEERFNHYDQTQVKIISRKRIKITESLKSHISSLSTAFTSFPKEDILAKD